MPAEDTPVMLHSLDREWRLLSVCAQWLRALGYERDEVVGRHFADFLTEDSRRFAVETVLPEFARSGGCSNVSCQMVRRDGQVIDVLMSATAGSGDAGSPAVLIDVTRRRQAEAARRQSDPPLHGPADSVRLGHWIWTPCPEGLWPFHGRSKYSTAAARIFGVEPGDLAIDDASFCGRFVHPDDRDRLLECLGRALEPDQAGYTAEYRILRADGAVRTVHEVAEVVRGDDGAVAQMMGSVQDITDMLRAERALRDSEERFRTLLEAAPTFLWMSDASGHVTYVSKPWCVYTGLPEAEALGLTWTKTIHPEDLARIREIETSAVEERRPFAMDYRILGADGAYRWFLDKGAPRFAPDGTFLGMAGSLFDISDRRRLETELQVSEARLHALADNSPMVIFLKDLEGRYLMVNREFERNHGIADAEIRGRTAFDIFPADEAEIYAAHDRGALESRAATRKEMAFAGPGGPRCLSVVKYPVFDSSGSLIGLGGLEFDITDIKRAEAAIRESEQRFRSIADMIPALIWMSDKDGECVFVNKTWLDYTGRSLESELGRGFADNIHSGDWQHTVESEGKMFARRQVFSTDYRLRGADLEYRWFLDTAAPRFSPEGEYLGYIGILVDITERRRLESELTLARDQAETANRTKTQFLANMSHELRTPLNAIIGFSEIMMKEMFGKVDSPHYLAYAGDINQSGRHLLDVINDILDLSKIEAGRLELHEEDCDVAEIVCGAVRLVQDRAMAGRLAMVARVAPDLPALYADARAVKQILLNLLSNSVKFTPEDGTVTLTAELTGDGSLLISVADTGIGISAEDLPRALEAFGQIDSSLSRRFEGTGLGLPLTRALADLHGATFALESEPGAGTRVTILFPPARVGRREAGAPDSPTPLAAAMA
jgi:PAS domain S-box-containing protein